MYRNNTRVLFPGANAQNWANYPNCHWTGKNRDDENNGGTLNGCGEIIQDERGWKIREVKHIDFIHIILLQTKTTDIKNHLERKCVFFSSQKSSFAVTFSPFLLNCSRMLQRYVAEEVRFRTMKFRHSKRKLGKFGVRKLQSRQRVYAGTIMSLTPTSRIQFFILPSVCCAISRLHRVDFSTSSQK